MALLTDDPITRLAFSIHANPGVYALLLGSGISSAAGIPTGWAITLDLVRRVALAQGETEQTDWATWYRTKFEKEPSYSELLEEIAVSPAERRSILQGYIEPTEEERREGKKLPTLAHHAIAKLVRAGAIKVIITTNFDRLLESALGKQDIEPTVVSSEDSLKGAQPLAHNQCYVLKIHGDYKDERILNTDRELSAYPSGYDALLDRVLDEYGLVVCGWSGEWDIALVAAIMRAPNRRFPFFWARRGVLGAGAQTMALHRKAAEIAIDSADEFFEAVQQRVETLKQTQQQNIAGVELFVNSVRRYLAKPEHRIDLDQLWTHEVRRLVAVLDGPDLPLQGTVSPDDFRTRVASYEALAEPLVKAAGVLGRWGDARTEKLIFDTLSLLLNQADKPLGGTVVWLNLRSYPAVLLFTAYGLALVRDGRWQKLHRLFAFEWTDGQQPHRLVSKIFLTGWKGARGETWKMLEGFERRKTPFSDHLNDLMKAWSPTFSGVEPEFDNTYDTFELLGALAGFEEISVERLEVLLPLGRRGDVLASIAIGRFGWNGASEAFFQRFKGSAHGQELLEAGFARANPRVLELFEENLKLYALHMG